MQGEVKKKDARQRAIDQIHGIAVTAFAGHKIEQRLNQGMFRSWRCRRDGTWAYGFDVTTIPGTLVITGDIGELIVQRADDMIAWASGSVHSIDYFAEKVPRSMQTGEFCVEVAKEFLSELRSDLRDTGDLDEETKDKIAELRNILDGDEVADFQTELYLSGLVDGCDMPNLKNYTSNFLWCREAVIWFCENWKQDEGEAVG